MLHEQAALNNKTIKVVIVFDEQLVADGLKCILSGQKNINVLSLVMNDENIFQLVPDLNPDIIIFEFSKWMGNYPKLMKKFHSTFPLLNILIISESVSHEIIKDIMPSISGYMVRTCSSEKVILAVNEIFKSGKYLCPKVLDEYFTCTRTVKSDSILSHREKEVLCTWIESKDNNEIAENLNISRSTVRTHMNNIRQKLGNLNHLQLMIYACRQNILNQNFRPVCPNCRSFCN